CVFAHFLAAEIQPSDIHSLVANVARKTAQHARYVTVEQVDHVPSRYRFEVEAVDSHDARKAAAEQRAGQLALAAGCDSANADEAREVVHSSQQRLDHFNAALFGD